jgi:hypothetical protein
VQSTCIREHLDRAESVRAELAHLNVLWIWLQF